jgi:serine/threonine-protein kinase
VIHRDLKPENILMQSGEPMIADFGIALAVSNAGGTRITQTGISLGTPQYMSPEQATGDRAIDGRTDIYSLAALTYEMLTGDPPHTASTAQAIIAKVLTERPTSVRATRATVPRHVSQAIERGLEKLPADRWSSAHEFGEALRGHAAETVVVTGVRETSAPAKSRWQSIRAAAWPAVFGATAVAAIWGWIAAVREPPPTTVRLPIMLPPGIRIANSESAVGSGLSISPDGRRVAFIGGTGSLRGVYVRNIGEIDARPVYREGSTNPGQPIFSPDGKWIAFTEGTRLKKVPADGGTPTTLVDNLGIPYGATWTSDGRIIVAAAGTLFSIPESGGRLDTLPRPATNPSFSIRWPVALPDGKTVAFSVFYGSLMSTRIGLISLTNGKVKLTNIAGNSPLGVIDGHLIYVNSSGGLMAVGFDTGRRLGCWTLPCAQTTGPSIQVVDSVGIGVTGAARAALSASSLVYVTGDLNRTVVTADMKGAIKPLVTRPAAYGGVRYSPDRKRIAMSISGATTDVWLYDVATGTNTRLTTAGTTNDRPEWSPDGSHVLFRTDRNTLFSIWWQPSDGTGQAEPFIRRLDAGVYEGSISPDGQSLLFRTGTTGSADIWYREVKGDTSRKQIAATSFDEWAARLSPNGKWVAYASNESGAFQVYVRPFPGTGPRVQVSKDGGEDPVWSPDGLRIIYHQNQEFLAANIRPGPPFAIASYDSLFSGDYLFGPGHATYDVTPDGRGLILIKPVGGESQLILVHDWKEEFRARIRSGTRR